MPFRSVRHGGVREGATRSAIALLALAALPCTPRPAFAQEASSQPLVRPFVRNTTRFELWRYYEPPPPSPTFTPGDPSTLHAGNRLLAGLQLRKGRFDATAALQYVQFGGLPDDAIGPGALGTGALYFDHRANRASHQVYLKTATVAMRRCTRWRTCAM